MRFVIADDMHTPRLVLKRILTEAGHEVIGEARNGTEAVAMTNQLKPDVVIFDISMPGGLMGDAAARVVRAEHPDLTIILSSNIDNEVVCGALKRDIDAHFVKKPFRTGQMLTELARIIGA